MLFKVETIMPRVYNTRISEYHKINNNNDDIINPEYPLKGLHIELSNVCNHQCLFCPNRKITRKKGFINENFLKRILKEFYQLGFHEVGLYANGEPFLSPNLPQYIRWAKDIGYSYVYIDTNGAAVEFDKIKDAINAGLDSIKFSINGTNELNYQLIHGTNDFHKVIDNLKKTYEYKNQINRPLNVFTSIAVTRYTEQDVDKFAEFLKQYCDDCVKNSVIDMGGYIRDELKYLSVSKTNNDFTQSMTIPCYLIFNSVFVSYEGYLQACCSDFQNYLVYADLNKTSFEEAWNNEIITDFRRRHLNNDVDGTPCMTCAYGKVGEWKPLISEYATICNKNELDGYDIEDRIKKYNIGREKNDFGADSSQGRK